MYGWGMQESMNPSQNKSWEDCVNEDAVKAIQEIDTHDALINALTRGITGEKLFYDQKGFNNFVGRLANPYGNFLSSFLSLLEFKGLCVKEDLQLTVTQFHEKMCSILARVGDLKEPKIDSMVEYAIHELKLRTSSQEVEIMGNFPDYCAVGNPELKRKYDDNDSQAKEFVFQCAKKLILSGARFYEDIWK